MVSCYAAGAREGIKELSFFQACLACRFKIWLRCWPNSPIAGLDEVTIQGIKTAFNPWIQIGVQHLDSIQGLLVLITRPKDRAILSPSIHGLQCHLNQINDAHLNWTQGLTEGAQDINYNKCIILTRPSVWKLNVLFKKKTTPGNLAINQLSSRASFGGKGVWVFTN